MEALQWDEEIQSLGQHENSNNDVDDEQSKLYR